MLLAQTLLIGLILLVAFLFILLFIEIRRQPRRAPTKPRRSTNQRAKPQQSSGEYDELIRLLYGDRAAADRLINSEMQIHGTPWNKAVLRVIRDLERDRGR